MKRRVVVTGLGTVTPIGLCVNDFWDSIKLGKNKVSLFKMSTNKNIEKVVASINNFNPEDFLTRKEALKLDRFIQFALVATEEAIRDSNLNLHKEDKNNIGVILSAAIGGAHSFEYNTNLVFNETPGKCSSSLILACINMLASKIAMKYGLHGICKSVISACATGVNNIGDAFRAIQYNNADIIIAGGSEAAICDVIIGSLISTRALSSETYIPKVASRPFDKDRDGFILGEGCGILILEELEHAKKRGAKIYAEIIGYGESCDAYDSTAPEPTGTYQEIAIRKALKEAKIEPSDIQYINMHGTSTYWGDIVESKTVERVFGDKDTNKNLLVSSTKSITGHLFAASGSIESIVCIKAINDNIAPPTINLHNLDEEVANLNYTPNKAKSHQINIAMNNSFGFGGTNAILIFKKYTE